MSLVQVPRGDLAHYDPEKGLETIARAEAAQLYFQRAKDATKLLAAVEFKLAEQRKFVFWHDAQSWPVGGRGKTHNRSVIGLPDPMVIHRWRSRLKDDGKFQVTLAAAKHKCLQVCEAYRGGLPENARSLGTGYFEWYTPAEYVEAARDVLGAFDLDPASSVAAQRTVQASRYFTMQDDGLAKEWHGRVWLNPPYSQPAIGQFIAKLVEEYTAGRTTAAILLTHNYTDNAWFHLGAGAAAAVCFTRGRIAFVNADGFSASPTQGQAFHYFGPDVAAFDRRFASIGLLMSPREATR